MAQCHEGNCYDKNCLCGRTGQISDAEAAAAEAENRRVNGPDARPLWPLPSDN